MRKVRNILEIKGNDVHSVTPEWSVYDALEVMVKKNIGALLVLENDKIVGIFTERDYARKVVLKGKTSKDTLIKDVMTENPVTVTPDHNIDQCMDIMVSNYVRYLPVIENGKLAG